MAAEVPEQRVIAVIDLRKTSPAAVTARRFHEVQAERAPGGDWAKVDFTRTVVIDDVATLAEHGDVYTHILDSGVDVSVLCIAVGELTGDRAIAVRRPYQLRAPWAATLWVSDPDGIRWRMDSSHADSIQQRSAPQGDDRLPGALTESVALCQVFDRVLRAVGDMPGAVASPGLYVNHSDVVPGRLSWAQQAAVKALAGTDLRMPQEGALVDTANLVNGSDKTPGRSDPIKAGGQLDQLYRKCQRAAAEAATAVERLKRPTGLLSNDGNQLRLALSKLANSAGELFEIISRALEWADPRNGFDGMQQEALGQYGIELPASRRHDATGAVDVLSEVTISALDRRQPLPAIAEQLRDVADRVAPAGTQPYLARLRRLCPDPAFRSLVNLRPVLEAGPPWLIAATFLAGLIAGLWPSPVALAGSLAAIGSIGAAAWIVARAAEIATAKSGRNRGFIGAYLGSVTLGALAGIALSLSIAIRVPTGLEGAAIGVAVALVVVTVLVGAWWSALLSRWLRGIDLPGLLRVPGRLRALVAEATTKEWQPAAERRAISDWARIMAGIVDDVSSGLSAYSADLSNSDQSRANGPPADSADLEQATGPNSRAAEIFEVVLIDLTDAVVGVLARLLAPLTAGSFATPSADAVNRVLKQQLSLYASHLATAGIYEAPPFGRGSEQRTQNVESLLEKSVGLEELIWSTTRDDRIVQLCAPEHLSLLELDPGSAEMIRFAPRSAQEFASRTLARLGNGLNEHASRVEWTATSRISGVLRLVPLRPDAVDEVVPAGQGAAESVGHISIADWPSGTGDDDD